MATEIKTLGSGVLRTLSGAFSELVLYAAPNPAETLFQATVKKAAMITGMRFFNSDSSTIYSIALEFIRFDLAKSAPARDRIHALPFPTLLRPGELRVETTPLVLEEGDLIMGYATATNYIHYVISGIERGVE